MNEETQVQQYNKAIIADAVYSTSPLLKALGWRPSTNPDTNHYLQQITLTDDEYKTLLALLVDPSRVKRKDRNRE